MALVVTLILTIYGYSVIVLWGAFNCNFIIALTWPKILVSEWLGGYNRYLGTVSKKINSNKLDTWM